MTQPPRVLVIRPSKEREAALRTLARTGAEIVVADHPDNDLAGFADVQLPLPRVPDAFRTGRVGELEDRIAEFHARSPLTAILADFDYLLPLVGRLNERFGLRGHTEASGLACSHKRHQRAALDRAGVPQPRWAHCRSRAAAHEFARTTGWPVVVKPADRSASCAVAVVHDLPALDAAVDAALAESWDGEALVEEYLDGPEVSVEAVVADGAVTTVAVTGKGIGGRTGTLKLDAETPARLGAGERAAVERAAADAVLACGLLDGPAHTEVRLTAHGPRIVEVNGRIGGVFISHMVRAVTGVDLYRAWYDVLHGTEPELAPRADGFAVRRCVSDTEGLVESVEMTALPAELAAAHLLTRCFVRPGDRLAPIENGNEMRAAVVAHADTREAAVEAADALAAHLVIRTTPLSQEAGA
ncbi:ATP-grasp domain-containing protein [Streptomyces sp. SID8379]|uniref:ATP-grasp domain-containing protein n=1 Tax=unclassified Streptomyces TaxID=2593676 RepID=UPI0003A8E47C|nr:MULTISPECIES: ATP-grasp domain-containing protein [unclassified Streptomyces]MYW67539.1 ATP-grasp domain-containing protein [Streptomyces sp. SID8379]